MFVSLTEYCYFLKYHLILKLLQEDANSSFTFSYLRLLYLLKKKIIFFCLVEKEREREVNLVCLKFFKGVEVKEKMILVQFTFSITVHILHNCSNSNGIKAAGSLLVLYAWPMMVGMLS